MMKLSKGGDFMDRPLNISYRNRDGTLYPELQISNNSAADNMPLGKYGQMCLNFLKEEYPERYSELRMSGDLMSIMHEVNDEAYKQIKELTDKLVSKDKETDRANTMQMFKLRNTCQASAEEIILNEFVYQPR